MNINLNSNEVTEAVISYVNNRGISTNGCDVDVHFTKARNGQGNVTADVSIIPAAIKTCEGMNEVDTTEVQDSLF